MASVAALPEIEIGALLNRRTDLSTFLVHLTKGPAPKAALASILDGWTIEARTAMGWAKHQAATLGPHAERSQKVVCFTETPLEHAYSLFAPIARRRERFEPYGVVFTKMTARRKGANPVWYVDMTPGHQWTLRDALDRSRDEACMGEESFLAHPGRQLFPFCERMGTWNGRGRQEFWWEREWRHLGNFSFLPTEIALVLCPETDHAEFEEIAPGKCVDPSWSLERTIAKLVGLSASDVTPFSA